MSEILITDSGVGRDELRTTFGDWAEVRNHPHTALLYLAVKTPRIIWTGRVSELRGYNKKGKMERDMTILFHSGQNVPGFDVANFMPDLTVWIGTTAGGREHGTCRARSFDGNTLIVGADMTCVWHPNDYISITDLHDLWPLFHRVKETEEGETVQVWKDQDLTDSVKAEYPVPVMGGPACAFIDETTKVAKVRFYGQDSYLVEPNSEEHYWDSPTGVTGWSWWFEGGTPSTSSAPNPEVSYSVPGQYVARLTVTGENGKTDVGFRNVFIYDENVRPYEQFDLSRLSGDLDGHGWEAELTVFGDGFDKDKLPDNAQAVLFSREWFAGQPVSARYGHAAIHGRENIKMVGWLTASHVSIGPDGARECDITLRGLQEYINGVTNYPVYFTQVDKEAPGWSKFKELTVKKVLYHLVKWHWTLMRFTDFIIPDDHNNHLPGQSFSEGSLGQCLDTFVPHIQSKWAVDRTGSLAVFSWPNWLPITGDGAVWRSRLYSDISLDDRDWTTITPQPRIEVQGARVWVEGVMANGSGWYAAGEDSVPGDVRNAAGATIKLTNQVLGTAGFEGSQGRELARMVLAEATSRWERVSFRMCGNYSMFDIVPYTNYFKASTLVANRDVSWANKPFWVTGMDIRYEDGCLVCDVVATPETMPDMGIQSYGDHWDIDVDLKAEPQGGDYSISNLLGDIAKPEGVLVPAMMGDGGTLLEADEPGKSYVRLYGDAQQVVKVENRMLYDLADRAIWVRATLDPETGRPEFQVESPRMATSVVSAPVATAQRAHTQHFAVFCMASGSASESYATPTFVVRRYRYDAVSISGFAQGASEDFTVGVFCNDVQFAAITLAGGDGGLVATNQQLEDGDRLDVKVLSGSGTNATVQVECWRYGI